MSSTPLTTDALVIGSGLAGGIAALELAQQGLEVALITRAEDPGETNTSLAQGGIVYEGEDDSPALLVADILRAGAGLSLPEAAEVLAAEGPSLIRRLLIERLGVPFLKLPTDGYDLTVEGAHSVKRILHVADATGRAIEERIIAAAQAEPRISLYTKHTAVDLITSTHHARDALAVYGEPVCLGAYVFDHETNQVRTCLARTTLLATGGLGQIYLHTTNSSGARGDGIAMARRAGARVINMEYVQFHPTAFYKRNAPRFLITEAMRGEGARLVTSGGEPFMQRFAPEWKDLAPRDLVARSIQQVMLETDSECVYLDVRSYVPPGQTKSRFPNLYDQCLAHGVDITQDLIPVVPAAHYSCGGIWVDAQGRSSLKGLYAAGEASCTGLHGANRLASTSLLECLVWGHRAALDMAQYINSFSRPFLEIPPWDDSGLDERVDPALIVQDMHTIQSIMWNYVGLMRTTNRLKRAVTDLRNLALEIEEFYRRTKLSDSLIGLRNAAAVAQLVANAALRNRQSRGCHYRMD